VATTYSRVTIVNGTRRVDLALPRALPLSEVMPQLLGYAAPDGRPERPVSWTLAPVGGTALSLTSTLADAGVTDGDLLELRAGQEAIQPAYVEDVRDVLEDTMDATAQPWRPQTTIGFALVAGGAGLTLTALLPPARTPASAGAFAAAALVAALLVAAGWWAARMDQRSVAQLLVALAAVWGALAGWLAATFPAWPTGAGVGSGLAGALLVAVAARMVTPVATAHLAGLSVAGAAGIAVAVTDLAGADPLAAVRLVTVGAVLLVGVLPRLSLTVGGLATADYRVRHHGLVTSEQLGRRIEASNALLYGSLLGAAVVGTVGGCLLATSGSGWDTALGTVVGVALMLRSRVFSRVPQIVPLRVAGLAVLAAHGVRAVAETPSLRPWTVVAAAATVGLVIAVSAIPLSEVARARVKQLLNRTELAVVAALVPLAAAALGLFDRMREIVPS
jgi:type VII secretion integral membrane protein EccD